MTAYGIYPLAEASRYIGVPLSTARSWFIGRTDRVGRGPLFTSDYAKLDGDYAISFINVIEAYVARFFKGEGVKPKILRRTHEILQEELNTAHPFAHADLSTNGVEIIRRDGNSNLIGVVSRQHFFPQMNLGRIQYNEITRLAEAWAIAKGVRLDPDVNYGKPVVENTGTSTLIVASQYRANGKDAALVARLFKLNETSVINAYNFEHGLGRVAA